MTNQDLYYSFMKNPEIKPQWGQAFFRDVFIPELLGSNTHSILYWAGKRMAREFPIATIEQLIQFFEQTKIGQLSVSEDKKTIITFKLAGPIVEQRIEQRGEDADFMFEAGFLAQSIEHQRDIVAEAEMDPKKNKKGVVTIHVHVDPEHPAIKFSNQANLNVVDAPKPQNNSED